MQKIITLSNDEILFLKELLKAVKENTEHQIKITNKNLEKKALEISLNCLNGIFNKLHKLK